MSDFVPDNHLDSTAAKTTDQKPEARLKLTGLWVGTFTQDSKERTFLSGTVGPGLKLLILPNGYKTKANDPDFIAYLTSAKPLKPNATLPTGPQET